MPTILQRGVWALRFVYRLWVRHRWWRILVFVPLMVWPGTLWLKKYYREESGFLRDLYWGKRFHEKAIPEFETAGVPKVQGGYDGIFYAQMSADPTFRREDVQNAMDAPGYRAKRVFIPFLSHSLGLGDPVRALHVYSVINYLFLWFFALTYVWRHPLLSLKQWLVGAALFWTFGTLVSVSRALTDLPAMVLSLWAVWWVQRGISSGSWAALSLLSKETMVAGLGGYLDWQGWKRGPLLWSSLRAVLILVPLGLWCLWLIVGLDLDLSGNSRNTAFPPFSAYGEKLLKAWAYWGDPARGRFARFEVFAALSLGVQVLYLLCRPRWKSVYWRYAIGFAALFSIIGSAVWAEQNAYTRVFLPLTAGFNFYLAEREKGWVYFLLFLLGNGGLSYMFLDIL